MAHRRAQMRLFNVCVRTLSRSHAVDKVLRVERRRVQILLRVAGKLINLRLRARFFLLELAGKFRFNDVAIIVDVTGSFRTAILDVSKRFEIFVRRHDRIAAAFEMIEGDESSGGELEARGEGVGNRSVVVDGEFSAHRADGDGRAFAQRPAD